MKRTGTLLLLAFILYSFSVSRSGATIYHSNGSAASVRALHNSAHDGDTITLPVGTFTWTTGVTISKAITLEGAGIGSTIIMDNVQGPQLIDWRLRAGFTSRLTGIELQDGGRQSAPNGVIAISGSNTDGSAFRWDNCKWNDLRGVAIFETVIGVIDHVQFVFGRVNTALFIYDSHWNGGGYGDGSWAAPTGFGSSQSLFIEDCTVTQNLPNFVLQFTDGYGGARFVVRHCTLNNVLIGNHGTESSGRIRGTRAMEVYNNTYTGTNINRFVGGSRSGGVLFHDNNISGFWNPPLFLLSNYRTHYPFSPWGGADGTSVWDVNAPNAFFTRTAASDSSGTTVTVSGSPNWTTNQWVGYSIRRTTNICNVNSITSGLILSNTANTITYTSNGGYSTPSLAFCAGDTLEIRKVIQCLDGIGRARGSLISGDPPVRPARWNDQVTEPCYSWNNFSGATHVNFSPTDPSVRAGEHFFNDTPMPGYTSYVYPHPLTTSLNQATLGNISTRGFVQTGDNVMVGGFIIQGTEPKTVIMRAIGPSLTPFGIPNALADPTLELHDGTGALIASNYNWQTTHIGGIITANQVSAIQNSGYAPSQASESAIVATLPPGNYTAIVSGVNNTTGVALVDVYDLQ